MTRPQHDDQLARCIADYVAAQGHAVLTSLLAAADPLRGFDAALARLHASCALIRLGDRIAALEAASGVPWHAFTMKAIAPHVEIAERIARDEAVRLIRQMETQAPNRSAA